MAIESQGGVDEIIGLMNFISRGILPYDMMSSAMPFDALL